MKTEVRITRNFKKEAKPLLKKYPSLIKDLAQLQNSLIANPTLGTPLGNNAYKIRLAIKSKGKGKSGGARVISFLENEVIGFIEKSEKLTVVNLVTIYDKSQTASISDKELKELIANIEY
ncbi:MAG: hypothetical protein AB7G44_08875 [Bacteroidia bacterium]